MAIIRTESHHDLKILPRYFDDIVNGEKRFEVRKNDRGFAVGDTVSLREWNGEYTGRYVLVHINYILDDERYCLNGYVIFGFDIVARLGML